MASSVSQLNNYSNFSLFSFDNADLLMKGMLMKQGAIDDNRAKLQQISDEVTNFSIVKDVDKKYLEERLAQTKDIVNKYSGGDLSNPNLMNQLVSKFETVVDDRVLNAVASASVISREDKEWEAKKGTPEYSDQNRAYALQNREKYLKDPNVGAEYAGGGGFKKFTDVDAIYTSKEFQDFLKNSDVKAEYITREDGSGYFKAINKYEAIDPQRLQQTIESFLGQDGREQLQINAWAKYGNPTSEEAIAKVREDYTSVISTQLENNEKKLEAVNKYLENKSLSAQERASYEDNKDILEKNINNLQSRSFDESVANPDGTVNEDKFKNVYTSIYEQNFKQEKFNLLYHDPIWKDSKIDEVQFKSAEYAETKRMHDMTAQKNQWEMQGKPMINPDGTVAKDANGNTIYLSEGANAINLVGENPNNETILKRGAKGVIDDKEANNIDIINSYQKDYKGVINSIVTDQKGKWNETSTTALESYLMSNTPTLGSNITLSNGKVLKVTKENIVSLEKLKAMTSGDNGVLRKVRNELRDYQENYSGALDKAYKEDPNTIRNTNLGNFYFVADDRGNLLYKEGKRLSSNNSEDNFQYLMRKKSQGKPLTKAEDASLKLYKVKAMLYDKDLTNLEKEQLYRTYRIDAGATTANSLPVFKELSKDAPKNKKTFDPQKDLGYPVLSINGVTYEVSQEEFKILQSKNKNIQRINGNTPSTKGKIFVRQSEYESVYKSPELDVKDIKRAYKSNLDAITTQSRKVIHQDGFTILPESTSADKTQKAIDNNIRESIRTRLSIPSDYKGDINFERVIKNGEPTDEFQAVVIMKDKVKNKAGAMVETPLAVTMPTKISGKELRAMGLNIETQKEASFTPFDASMGIEAEKLNIVGSDAVYNQSALNKGSRDPRAIFTPEAKNYLSGVQEEMRIRLKAPNFDIFEVLSKKPYLVPELSFRAVGGEAYYLTDENGEVFKPSRYDINGKLSKIKDEFIPEIKANSDNYVLDYIESKIKQEYNLY